MKVISLFSGIGGFELAAEWAGWQNIVSCEINPFGRKVIEYYWPKAYHHDDIHTLTYEKIDYEMQKRFGTRWRTDDIILTGGFPCQPYSAAGKRLGKEDERHLWPEMLRVIREVQPRWVVGENVLGLVNWSGGLVFEEVQADLEAQGYEVQPFILPAASVGNCPHKRDRVWFVAYSNNKGRSCGSGQVQETNGEIPKRDNDAKSCDTGNGVAPDTDHNGYATTENGQGLGEGNDRNKTGQNDAVEFEGRAVSDWITTDTASCGRGQIGGQRESRFLNETGEIGNWDNFPTQSPICSRNDGIPTELDGITFSKWRNESIKAAGNAIVPQVVYQIFKAINEYENLHTNRKNP